MKRIRRYKIEHFVDKHGKDVYSIYYKRDDLPWQRLATADDRAIAEQVIARLRAEDQEPSPC